ncbi:hypothetical protein WI665_10125, partial [Vibrio cholerae]
GCWVFKPRRGRGWVTVFAFIVKTLTAFFVRRFMEEVLEPQYSCSDVMAVSIPKVKIRAVIEYASDHWHYCQSLRSDVPEAQPRRDKRFFGMAGR